MKIILGPNYPRIVLPLIAGAKTGIDILIYHWGYYGYVSGCDIQKFNYEIKSALHRGVPVRALLHCGSPSDGLRRKNAETANHLRNWGANVKFFTSGGTLHSKLILIDRTIAILGSHNFSRRSFASNIETSVVLEGSGDIRELQDYFNLLWGQS